MHQHLKKLLSLGMHLAKYMTLFYLQERALFSSLIVDPSWRVRCAKWQILFWKETRSSCFRKIYISIKWLHLRVINAIKNLSNVYLGDAMHFGRLFTDQISVCKPSIITLVQKIPLFWFERLFNTKLMLSSHVEAVKLARCRVGNCIVLLI